MPVTMQSIAKHLGISQATVSNALRRTGRVSEAMRARIEAAALELGYRPNASARAMRLRRFEAVGLLIGSGAVGSSYLREGLIEGLSERLTEAKLHLHVAQTSDQRLSDPLAMPLLLREWRVDGLLVSYVRGQPSGLAERFKQFDLPAVWLTTDDQEDCVGWDDHLMGRQAAEHLAGLGHRVITLLSPAPIDPVGFEATGTLEKTLAPTFSVGTGSFEKRIAGFLAGARALGVTARLIAPEPTPGSAPAERAVAWTRQVFLAADRPQAVFVPTETSLTAVLLGIAQAGLHLPEALDLVAVAGRPVAIGGLRLDTLVVDRRELGRVAAEMLITKIAQPRTALPRRSLPATLVKR